jgi:MFS family permease
MSMRMPSVYLEWLTKDGKLILAARIMRAFSYGFLSIILAIYLKLVGLNDILIGLVLTATLVNSVVLTLFASFYADRIGRRKILIIYAALMSISGAIFLVTEDYLVLVIAALIGTINVTGTETGAFLSIEQAILPQTIKDIKKRNASFAVYNMAGTFAMSAGILLSGLPEILQKYYGFVQVESIKPLFLLYSAIGIAVIAIYFFLSKKIEVDKAIVEEDEEKKKASFSKILTVSPESKTIVTKLAGLFAVDSFAGGFVLQSIVSFWFFTKFNADLASLSFVFSVAGVLTAFSFIAASKIADKIGLINTVVFTHIPSNILLVIVAFAPTFPLAIAFYLARMALSQMDVPTRQSYIVAVVREDERTAAAGITNASRNVAQAISPSLTGAAIHSLSLSSPFVIGGLLKIAYDIAIYLNFRKIKPPEEESKK